MCRQYAENHSSSEKDFDALVQLIYEECLSPQLDCTFLNTLIEFIPNYRNCSASENVPVNLVDARALLEAAYLKSVNQSYRVALYPYIGAIFRGKKFRRDEEQRISEIEHYIGLLNKLKRNPCTNVICSCVPFDEAKPSNMKQGPSIAKPEVAYSKDEKTSLNASLQTKLEIEQEISSRTRDRLEHHHCSVESWHRDRIQLNEKVLSLQAELSGLLNQFLGFSEAVTDNYILRFANNLIELYNLVFDGFTYHNSRSLSSNDADYYNAVANYQVYMDVISDALADFGIEELRSSSGNSFDGHIHIVRNTSNYTPRTAKVQKSVRPGFRYGKTVIQKEWIEV